MISLLFAGPRSHPSTRTGTRAARRGIRNPRAVLALLLAFAAVATPVPANAASLQGAPGIGSIVGTVAEAESLQPIAGAVVRLVGTDHAAVTNSAGRLQAGEHPGSQLSDLRHRPGAHRGSKGSRGGIGECEPRRTADAHGPPIPLERIQVTATKNPVSIGAAPAQVTVVDEEQIAREGDFELTQAIDNVPGLFNSTLLYSFESVDLESNEDRTITSVETRDPGSAGRLVVA